MVSFGEIMSNYLNEFSLFKSRKSKSFFKKLIKKFLKTLELVWLKEIDRSIKVTKQIEKTLAKNAFFPFVLGNVKVLNGSTQTS